MEAHLCNFVDWAPSPYVCGGFSDEDSNQQYSLAMGTKQGDIQIWRKITKESIEWSIERIFRGEKEGSLNTLTWISNRLFSGGKNGTLVEWDLKTLTKKVYTNYDSENLVAGTINLSPIWCLSSSPKNNLSELNNENKQEENERFIAAGCEDGYVRIFRVEKDQPATFFKSFTKAKARVLSVDWHPSGKKIAGGDSKGNVYVWDLTTGSCESFFNVKNSESLNKSSSNPIWVIRFLRDFTIVTGDSLGFCGFWDANTETLVQSFHSHLADILTIAVNQSQDKIYCSGVDSKIITFSFLEDSNLGRKQWTQTGNNRSTHSDIKVLSLSPDGKLLINGANDGILRVAPLQGIYGESRQDVFLSSRNNFSVAPDHGLFLVKYEDRNTLDLFRLGSTSFSSSDMKSGSQLAVQELPKRVLQLGTSGRNVVSSAISPDGKFLAYSDDMSLRLFHLKYEGNGCQVRKMKIPTDEIEGTFASIRMIFTKDSKYLVLATFDKNVCVLNISNGDAINVERYVSMKKKLIEPLSTLALNSSENELAVGSLDNSIRIFSFPSIKEIKTNSPPQFDSHHFSTLYLGDHLLVISCIDKKVYIWDTAESSFHPWSQKALEIGYFESNSFFRHTNFPALGLSAIPNSPNKFIIYTNSVLVVIDLDQPSPDDELRMIGEFHPLAFFSFMGPDKILALVVSFQELKKKDEILVRKRYNE